MCVCLSISTCHFVHLNRCICLLTVGAYCALFLLTLGGALAVALRLCVNQAALQTASQAPHHVGSCSSPVLSCHSKFLSSLPLFLQQSLNHHHLFSGKYYSLNVLLSGICGTILQWMVIKGCKIQHPGLFWS